MFTRILVGYDGSQGSRAALAAALDLAAESRGTITVITVQHQLPGYDAISADLDEEPDAEGAEAGRLANEIQAAASDHKIEVKIQVAAGHPAHEIAEAAKRIDADLVVVGHSGHSGLWGSFLGATTERVSRYAPCSVLIVR
jgi:nucleotide-binding universal stress UspA family protein